MGKLKRYWVWTGVNNTEAEQIHHFNWPCIGLQTRNPCYRLWHRRERLWVMGYFPAADHTNRERHHIRNTDYRRKMAVIVWSKGSSPQENALYTSMWLWCVFNSLTVVIGWLHVDVSKSRMCMWLFQPRPGLSHCRRSGRRHDRNKLPLYDYGCSKKKWKTKKKK